MRGRGATALVGAAIALYAALCLSSMRLKSPTFDECAHLPAGYTYLKLGDHRLNPEHPPLIKLLAATPLLFLDVTLKTEDEAWALRRQWEFGRRFLYRWNDADRLLFWGRVPIVALGAFLAVAVFSWTRRHWGLPAAALALVLCVLSPDMLAHGQIVTTDVGIALFTFLSVVAFERFLERGTWLRLLLAGLAAGAAFATKFSAVVLVPMLAGLALMALLSPEPMAVDFSGGAVGPKAVASRAARLRASVLSLAAIGILAWVVLWAAYGFRSPLSPDPAVSGAFDWSRVEPESRALGAVARLAKQASLLPEAYLFGFLRFFKHSEGRPSFLMGRLSEEGWWYYFPATFALKTPLPLILLLALALGTRAAHASPWRTECFLWLPVILYLALTLTRNVNIGHRHLLPIYPFLFAAAGRAASWAAAKAPSRAPALLVAGLAVWYALGAARIHPHYLAYFNELAGGPRNGYKHLVDSNLDWGQDLKGLKAYMDRNGIGRIKLSYFGTGDPSYYGIDCDLLPGQMLPPAREVVREVRPGDLVAVSATNLQGVYLEPEVRPLMARFRALRPLDSIGYSILVYRADFAWSLPAPP